MKITVVIPTYNRPKELERCLEAFKGQTRSAYELFVIVRDTDVETWTFLKAFNSELLPLMMLTVHVPGVVAAMNLGLDAASGDVIAFTDDDAVPHPDWLERIEFYFLSDQRIGGVGGRDLVYHGTQLEDGAHEVVGKLQWFGRMIGNHHIGIGKAREVDVLKGVNMSFRHSAIAEHRFDVRMRGSGAQVHFELAFSLSLKQAGWKIIYDPKIAVDHYPAQRFDEDLRKIFSETALVNLVHNETFALLEYLSNIQRFIYITIVVLVGTREAPGFLQWLRLLQSEGLFANQKLLASLRGRWLGYQTWKQGKNNLGDIK